MNQLKENIAKRRTFAIIAHPDAGKTTLTEKLLLFGGAIQLAGAVKARGNQRRATSDWMKVERERGISVSSSVMTFDYKGKIFNLLDTPGHQDFSEDTYRVLTAVDSAVMILDGAQGIETQTKKLFEVCKVCSISSIKSNGSLDSLSILFINVVIGISLNLQTSNNFFVWDSIPWAASKTITEESTAVNTLYVSSEKSSCPGVSKRLKTFS